MIFEKQPMCIEIEVTGVGTWFEMLLLLLIPYNSVVVYAYNKDDFVALEYHTSDVCIVESEHINWGIFL